MVGPGRRWPPSAEIYSAVPFLHRDVVVGDLARHLAMVLEDEAGNRRYIWEQRNILYGPHTDSLTGGKQGIWDYYQLVFQHCRSSGHFWMFSLHKWKEW
jgi:hypothetical protein